jgi:hypothetical protein
MQSVGGSLGGERANLPIIEREVRERQVNNAALKNNAAAITALTTEIRVLSDAMTGGVDA